MAKRRPVQFWEGHLEAWRQSGLTQVEYCARHELNRKSFGRWVRKSRMAPAQQHGLALTLVPACLASPASGGAITLHSPSGWKVELPADRAWLPDLLRQLS